jgi:hypothetical protein
MKDGERLVAAADHGLLVLSIDLETMQLKQSDLRNARDRADFRNAMVGAAYYSDILRAKTRFGKLAKAKRGEVDKRRSFGFEADGVTVREDEAEVLRFLAEHFLHGDSQDALIRWLDRRGVRTTRGASWSRPKLRALLTRPRNAGIITNAGVPVSRLPGTPLIDEATHNRVLAKFAARRPGRPLSPAYLCSGVAVCGLCGVALAGRPRASKGAYPDGGVRREYWCSPSGMGGCSRISIDQRNLDEWAGDFCVRTLSDPAHADALARAELEMERSRAALLAESEEITATITELDGRLARRDPGWTLARHDGICKPLEARLAEIESELSGLAVEEPVVLSGRTIPERGQWWLGWLEQWTEGTPEEQRAMLRRALGGRKLIVGSADPRDLAAVDGRVSLSE